MWMQTSRRGPTKHYVTVNVIFSATLRLSPIICISANLMILLLTDIIIVIIAIIIIERINDFALRY